MKAGFAENMRHLTVLALLSVGVSGAATVEEILARLDQAAPKFVSMTADLDRTTYTKVLDEKAVETGTITIRKQGKDLQVLIKLEKPDQKLVSFRGKKAEIYFPKLKTVQEWDLGKHSDLIDQFLLVGFGSGRDLRASYNIRYVGQETVAGQRAHRLELTPTAASIKDKLRRVDLWIADNGSYPVQQRFLQPSGDYYLATYADVKLNPSLNQEALSLNLPKGVKRERPQK